MFQFKKADGSPQGSDGPQLFLPFVQWDLPAVNGGVRRWSLIGRDITYGGNTFAKNSDVIDWSPQLNEAQIGSREDWELLLSDENGTWKNLLARGFYRGTKCVVAQLRFHDGAQSSNAQFLCVGWAQSANGEVEDGSRIMRVAMGNELWNLNRDASLLMTSESEQSVDEDADSLDQVGESQTFSWGTKQGTRRR